jgi:putative hydrolase of the HAD superfamily
MNIIFDLGGVILSWNGEHLIDKLIPIPDSRRILRTHLLQHKDWDEMDRGTLDYAEVSRRTEQRTGIPASQILAFLKKVPDALKPFPEILQLLNQLKQEGHRLYVLSNMHVEVIEHLDKTYSFWNCFDGRVISCRIKKIKPAPEIYQHLIQTYNLNPKNSVFIDDMAKNLTPAAALGMATIHFKNPQQCEADLRRLIKQSEAKLCNK